MGVVHKVNKCFLLFYRIKFDEGCSSSTDYYHDDPELPIYSKLTSGYPLGILIENLLSPNEKGLHCSALGRGRECSIRHRRRESLRSASGQVHNPPFNMALALLLEKGNSESRMVR